MAELSHPEVPSTIAVAVIVVSRHANKFGGKLHIPEPFELMLDTGTLPLPK